MGAMRAVTIAGYASLFSRRDASGDLIRRGAFSTSLARRGARGVAMLWQHDPSCPIGVWTHMSEDAHGLRVVGELLPDVVLGREAATLVAAGAVTGLSIGFRALKARREAGRLPSHGHPGPAGGGRTLFDIDLWEVSLVTFPQVDGARVRLLPPRSPASPRRPQ